jgi:hypothetical protein
VVRSRQEACGSSQVFWNVDGEARAQARWASPSNTVAWGRGREPSIPTSRTRPIRFIDERQCIFPGVVTNHLPRRSSRSA